MNIASKITSSTKRTGIAGYLNLARKIPEKLKKGDMKPEKAIRIAILASSTVRGMKEVLMVQCWEAGIIAEIFVGGYNQYSQEILDRDGELYRFAPDLVIFFADTMSILGDRYFLPYDISEEARRNLVKETLEEFSLLVERLKEGMPGKILLHNFEVPSFSPLGIAENRKNYGFVESVQDLNNQLRAQYKEDNQVFVLDYDAFCSRMGKRNTINYKMYYLGDIKLDIPFIPELCREYMAYIKADRAANRKCIVLDLDNTLWGGIIGEDGLEGIKLGPTPEGRPFWEFQKCLLSLFQRGIILAINSKNNAEDALAAFREHPYMVLKEEHFAALKINWNDKISNMKAIAQEINIGLDSLVFFDDDKMNRMMIREALPEVSVVELPDDPSLYLKTLMEMNDFSVFSITQEDKEKGHMYAQQRKRRELQEFSSDITKYLRALEMVVTIKKDDLTSVPRIAQLTQKTNQFNMTTRRYSEQETECFAAGDRHMVVSAKVEDKFGDNGLTGLAIVEKGKDQWRVDSFLMSCRIIGRGVEDAIIAYVVEEAKKEEAKSLVGEIIPSKKNAPARGFYKGRGFRMVKEGDGMEIWEYDLGTGFGFPEFMKVVKE